VPLPCSSRQIAADFSVLRGSGEAGHISYVLRLRNKSQTVCFVSGLAPLVLLRLDGRTLPTRVIPRLPGAGTAVRVVLRPGASAWARGRFSPDVPGPGETTARQCEPTAYKILVAVPPRGGTTVGPVRPPTPVCEHGTIELSLLSARRPVP
jgi:hypothetical protein